MMESLAYSMDSTGIDVDRSCVRIFETRLSKREVLEELVDAVAAFDGTDDPNRFRAEVFQRESVMSTGIGDGVAIPHVRFAGIHKPTVGIGISMEGVDFNAMDNEPVQIFVLFAMPIDSDKHYLDILAQVMLMLKTPGFREVLLSCTSAEDVVQSLRVGGFMDNG